MLPSVWPRQLRAVRTHRQHSRRTNEFIVDELDDRYSHTRKRQTLCGPHAFRQPRRVRLLLLFSLQQYFRFFYFNFCVSIYETDLSSCRRWWNPLMDHPKILTFIQAVITQRRIDTNRVHVMGFSQGGWGSWNLLCKYPTNIFGVRPSTLAHAGLPAQPSVH